MRPSGRLVAVGISMLAIFVLHSGFIRYHSIAGEAAFSRQAIGQSAEPLSDPSRAAAIGHLEWVARWGLVRTRDSQLHLAVLYQQTGQTNRSQQILNELLAQDPSDTESRLHLARTWLQDGRLELARKQAETVLRNGGVAGQVPQGSVYDRRLRAAAHQLLGDVAAQQRDPDSALRHFMEATRLDPDSAVAHLALGTMLAAAGRLEEATESFASSVELEPSSAAAHNNLAALLVQQGRPEAALPHYRKSLELLPDNPLAYANVGLVLAKLNRLEEAAAAFQQALVLDPDNAIAIKGLAELGKGSDAAKP